MLVVLSFISQALVVVDTDSYSSVVVEDSSILEELSELNGARTGEPSYTVYTNDEMDPITFDYDESIFQGTIENPTWTAADIATSADGAIGVFVADMDGDGDMDIVSSSYQDDTIAWYENDGNADPTWTASDIATNVDGIGVFVADMDGDGDLDIVSASFGNDTIAWY